MLAIGNKAPSFSANDQNGAEVSDTSLLGKKYILFFYGQDDTPTCNKQVFGASASFEEAQKKGFDVFGVSRDTVGQHKKFISKYDLKVNLLSDPQANMMIDFESYGPKIFMGKEVNGVYRKAYFIDENGTITNILTDVKASEQGQLILDVLNK